MIEIRNLAKSFGSKQVLKNVNLEIKEQKTTVILGVSGGGKSTIIKHIVRLLEPDHGEIFVEGVDVVRANQKELFEIRKKVGFLFQSGALFDSMNVFDNVAFPLREHLKLSKNEIRERVYSRLEIVGLKPDEVAKLFPDELSGGMRKRVGLARTVILNPKVILYDEPTSGLDPTTSDLITQMILTLQRELKTTSVLISHDMKESFKAGDYFAMLYNGEIVEYGDNEQFQNSQNRIVRHFIEGTSVEEE